MPWPDLQLANGLRYLIWSQGAVHQAAATDLNEQANL